jgi:hypothetical protein
VRQTELTQKNIDRLRQFDNQLVRAQLLHLPELLMQRAEELLSPKTGVTKPFRAARMARVAVAIEILLNIPLRIGNLVNLRLGEHLRYIDTRTRRFTSLAVQCHETKNHRDIEWEISKELDHFLQRYIKRFRAILGTEEGNCLFPAGFGRRGSLSEEAMAANLKQVIAEEIGATVNPHLFRCFAAKLILEDNPGALEDVRQILGDKTLAIVLAHYAAMQPALAARRHGALLRKIRVSALSTRNEPKVKARMVKL